MNEGSEIIFGEIFVEHGVIKKMHESENFSERTIGEALKRPRFTKPQMRIRELALAKYQGVLRDASVNGRTRYEESED